MHRFFYKRAMPLFCLYVFVSAVLAQATNRTALDAHLIAAQKAIQEKHPDQALIALDLALAHSAVTPVDNVTIARMRVVAAVDSGKPDTAILALEYLMSAREVPAAEKPNLLQASLNLALKQKNYGRVLDMTARYAEISPEARGVLIAQAQAHYFLKQYAACTLSIKAILNRPEYFADPSSGSKAIPEEYVLRMQADSYSQLKNHSAHIDSLALLLRYYPKASYWSDYLSRQLQTLEPKSNLELEWYRLMRFTASLEETDDYLIYIQLALKAGFPQEAATIFAQGEKLDLLNTTKVTDQHALKQLIMRRIAEDSGAIAALNKQSLTGDTAAQLGDLHFAAASWAEAQKYYAQAIALGVLRKENQVRLHWGIAAALQGDRSAAISILKWSGFDAPTQALTKAWGVWLASP